MEQSYAIKLFHYSSSAPSYLGVVTVLTMLTMAPVMSSIAGTCEPHHADSVPQLTTVTILS